MVARQAFWVRIQTFLKYHKLATQAKEWPTHSSQPKKRARPRSKILMLFRMKSSFELGDDQPEPRSRIIKKVQRSGPFQKLLHLIN